MHASMRSPRQARRARLTLLLSLGLAMGCSQSSTRPEAAPAADAGPFAAPSTLPYHYPEFDRIKDADYRPAFVAGMAEQRKEVDAIAHNPEAPTFENTIVALEKSGQVLARVNSVFGNLSASNTNDEIQKIELEMAPKLAAHSDAIFLDPALFARVQQLYDKRDGLGLDPESKYLVERYHTQFVRAGAQLPAADKEKLKKMNEEVSSLTTQFQQNLLKATNDAAVVVDNKADLAGLSDDEIGACAQAAKSRKLDGKYVIAIKNTTTQPFLAQLQNRALRERLYKASITRGIGGQYDNTGLIARIVRLRAERAALLGYPNHAAYVLADETAGTVAAVNKMQSDLAPAAEANARKEAAAMQKIIDADAKAAGTKPFKLEPWDWQYYSEKVRKAEFAYDEAEAKPYFEMNRVMQDGVFYAANKLYGLTFKERTDLPKYNPDTRVFEVFNEDGSSLAIFIADYYARDNKQGGAWMNEYVSQSRLFGYKPVVVNNLNIPKPPAGQPTLLTFDEVTTMFHEFGHGVHGMFSNVEYPLFAGTAVPRDFVEFPSQYNEMWASDPGVFAHYARHYQTGAAMPKPLLDKVLASSKLFNQGFATTEYLAASLVDQAWHQIPAKMAPDAKGVPAFEAAALKKAGVDWYAVPPRYHSAYFAHIFVNSYSAGYYAYLWSDVLAQDTADWMRKHGGLERANGDYLRAKILSRGRSADPIALFKDFYGKDPDVGPLLESRGLTLPKKG